jgi:hypothetical protein
MISCSAGRLDAVQPDIEMINREISGDINRD